jgi:hypothetical protein
MCNMPMGVYTADRSCPWDWLEQTLVTRLDNYPFRQLPVSMESYVSGSVACNTLSTTSFTIDADKRQSSSAKAVRMVLWLLAPNRVLAVCWECPPPIPRCFTIRRLNV